MCKARQVCWDCKHFDRASLEYRHGKCPLRGWNVFYGADPCDQFQQRPRKDKVVAPPAGE